MIDKITYLPVEGYEKFLDLDVLHYSQNSQNDFTITNIKSHSCNQNDLTLFYQNLSPSSVRAFESYQCLDEPQNIAFQ